MHNEKEWKFACYKTSIMFFCTFQRSKGKRDLVMAHTCFILAFARLKQTKNKPALQVKAIWALESWKEVGDNLLTPHLKM